MRFQRPPSDKLEKFCQIFCGPKEECGSIVIPNEDNTIWYVFNWLSYFYRDVFPIPELAAHDVAFVPVQFNQKNALGVDEPYWFGVQFQRRIQQTISATFNFIADHNEK